METLSQWAEMKALLERRAKGPTAAVPVSTRAEERWERAQLSGPLALQRVPVDSCCALPGAAKNASLGTIFPCAYPNWFSSGSASQLGKTFGPKPPYQTERLLPRGTLLLGRGWERRQTPPLFPTACRSLCLRPEMLSPSLANTSEVSQSLQTSIEKEYLQSSGQAGALSPSIQLPQRGVRSSLVVNLNGLSIFMEIIKRSKAETEILFTQSRNRWEGI